MVNEAVLLAEGESEDEVPLSEHFEQLRDSLDGRWDMSSETALLRTLQQLHTRLISRSTQTYRNVEGLCSGVAAAQASLSNTFSELRLLSQRHFVQHRIAREDRQQSRLHPPCVQLHGEDGEDLTGSSRSSSEAASLTENFTATSVQRTPAEAAVRRRMRAFMETCKEGIAETGVRVPLHAADEEELEDFNPYAHRRLCGLIGTTAFLRRADIGGGLGDRAKTGGIKGVLSPAPPSQSPRGPMGWGNGAAPASLLRDASSDLIPSMQPRAVSTTTLPPEQLPSSASENSNERRAMKGLVPPNDSVSAPPASKRVQLRKIKTASKPARQRALFSSSSSSSSAPSPAAPAATATLIEPLPQSPATKRSGTAKIRPTKPAPKAKAIRPLFESSTSSEILESNTASSASSSSIISSDGSTKAQTPTALEFTAQAAPSALPLPGSSLSSSTTSSLASVEAPQVPSGNPTVSTAPPPPPLTAPVPPPAVQKSAVTPSPRPPPPLPPVPIESVASPTSATLLPPPPQVFFTDAVPSTGVVTNTNARSPSPPPFFSPASTAAPPSPLPPRRGKVLNTSSDEDI